jgi:fatty acid amide hydrolase 2
MTAITGRSALSLATAIRTRELSAAEVVDAHIAVLQRAQPTINALAAERFALAREEAAAADERIGTAGSGEQLPPLLGVPFTVKESLALAGMPQSAGLAARAAWRSEHSAPPVQRLLDAGAIPLGVTNTSELTLWIESVNRVYGRTRNPFDPRRAAGGSSGGEGAAVGCGGSPFGLASDIAGSIRIPALFCGVFGHKPSSGLVPTTGNYPPSVGENGRMLGIGPIARRAEDLMAVLRIVAGPDGADRFAQEIELGNPEQVSLEGLRVVIAEGTSWRPMSRELHEAREAAAGALAAAGARLQRIKLRSWRGALLPLLTTLQAGSGSTTSELLTTAGARAPTARSLLTPGGQHTMSTRIMLASQLLPAPEPESARARKRLERGRQLADELTATIGDGVLLHPAHRRSAPLNGTTVGRPWLLTPSGVFNLAGVPVTEVPLGRSRQGLPLGVQVAAGPKRDHVSIAVAIELERAFGGWAAPLGRDGQRSSGLAPHS